LDFLRTRPAAIDLIRESTGHVAAVLPLGAAFIVLVLMNSLIGFKRLPDAVRATTTNQSTRHDWRGQSHWAGEPLLGFRRRRTKNNRRASAADHAYRDRCGGGGVPSIIRNSPTRRDVSPQM